METPISALNLSSDFNTCSRMICCVGEEKTAAKHTENKNEKEVILLRDKKKKMSILIQILIRGSSQHALPSCQSCFSICFSLMR